MRVVLLFPQWTQTYGIFGYFARRHSGRPPLGLAYLAAVAERAGHEVRIIDGQREGLGPRELARKALAERPDIVGITAASPFWDTAREIAAQVKALAREMPLAVGGPHITILEEQAFDPVFDYGFVGEADQSWPEFLNRLEAGRAFEDIKGILFRENGVVRFTGMPDPVDIEALPFPARHLLSSDYWIGTPKGRKRLATIMWSRGCPFRCAFCATSLLGKRVRKRSPESVIEEMASVVCDFKERHFLFEDDNLTLDRAWMLRFCDLLERCRLPLTFEGCTRADLLDEELVKRMAGVGLVRLMLGLESADPEIRRIIKKDIPLACHAEANALCARHGVETLNFVMLGLPGETRETVKRTLDYLRGAHDIGEVTFSIATPYPGTELLEMAGRGEYGLRLMTEDWSKYRRYGSAVMAVNDLSPGDLVRLQNDGLASIYLAPWRWRPMWRKMGLLGVLLTLFRLILYLGHKLTRWTRGGRRCSA